MRLAFYRGRSLISLAIRWFTRGDYSHVAIILDDDRIVEAWHDPAEVRFINHLGDGHEPGTVVDVFAFEPAYPASATEFAAAAVGMRYDFAGVLGFLTKRSADKQDRVFCSELAMMTAKAGGAVLLQNVQDWKVSPSMLAMSPLLKFQGSVVTRKDRMGVLPVDLSAPPATATNGSVDRSPRTSGTGGADEVSKRETKRVEVVEPQAGTSGQENSTEGTKP